MTASNLRSKQKCFTEEYIIDFNATQAAIRAGYSKKTAGQMGHELLQKPSVKAHIHSLVLARIEKIRATADQALDELRNIAFAKDGSVKTSDRLKALQALLRYTGEFEKQVAGQLEELNDAPNTGIVVPELVITCTEDGNCSQYNEVA